MEIYLVIDEWEDDCGYFECRTYCFDSEEKATKHKEDLIESYRGFFDDFVPAQAMQYNTQKGNIWSYTEGDKWGTIIIEKNHIAPSDNESVFLIEEKYKDYDGINNVEVECAATYKDAMRTFIKHTTAAEEQLDIKDKTQIKEDEDWWYFHDDKEGVYTSVNIVMKKINDDNGKVIYWG